MMNDIGRKERKKNIGGSQTAILFVSLCAFFIRHCSLSRGERDEHEFTAHKTQQKENRRDAARARRRRQIDDDESCINKRAALAVAIKGRQCIRGRETLDERHEESKQ
jgi:hypothetical protein